MQDFRTRVLLVVVAVLLSLVVSLAAALIAYAADRNGLTAVAWGGGAFLGTMTLALGVLTVLLP